LKLNKYLFLKVYFPLIISSIIIGIILLFFTLNNLQKEIIKRQQFNQDNFIENMSNDLLSGLSAESYKKCKILNSNLEIISVKLVGVNNNIICDLNMNDGFGYTLESKIYFDENNVAEAANLKVKYSVKPLLKAILKLFVIMSTGFLFLSFILIRANKGLKDTLLNPLVDLSVILKGVGQGKRLSKLNDFKISELNNIFTSTEEMSSNLKKYEIELVEATKNITANEVAKQVAHDIRSPLTALNMLSSQVGLLPDNKGNLFKMAVQRVNDIANDLLDKNPSVEAMNSTQYKKIQLSASIQAVIAEKKIVLKNLEDVNIVIEFSEFSDKLFSDINEADFMRAISNLINNSIEAIKVKGQISINLYSGDDFNVITIIDDGAGISSELMERIGEKGLTSGKEMSESGSGLGVFGAKKIINSFGGSLKFLSELGKGTTASIYLPKSSTKE